MADMATIPPTLITGAPPWLPLLGQVAPFWVERTGRYDVAVAGFIAAMGQVA